MLKNDEKVDFGTAGAVECGFRFVKASLVRAGSREMAFGDPLKRLLLERGHAKPLSGNQKTRFD